LLYIESFIFRLLAMLCAKPLHTIQVREFNSRTHP
jgi:hypothetical protein